MLPEAKPQITPQNPPQVHLDSIVYKAKTILWGEKIAEALISKTS